MNRYIHRSTPDRAAITPFISIIIPVFNEAETVADCAFQLHNVLHQSDLSCYELLFVNDGSADDTLAHLFVLAEQDSAVRIINFSRNFGKEAALSAGLDYARGDVVIPIDVDLQDPPELLPEFVRLWRAGYDVVYGVRIDRRNDSFGKRTTAGLFYRLFNYASSTPIPAHAGDFRLLDRRVVEVLKQLPERNRFMKGLFAWAGFKSTGVEYERLPRRTGTTKWNYWHLWNFALDGLFSFSTTPLRLWSYIGGGLAFLAFSYMLFIILRVLILGVDTPGYASLISVILFLGGIQLLSLGIIGEYLGRLMLEVKGRPLYILEGIYPPEDEQNSPR